MPMELINKLNFSLFRKLSHNTQSIQMFRGPNHYVMSLSLRLATRLMQDFKGVVSLSPIHLYMCIPYKRMYQVMIEHLGTLEVSEFPSRALKWEIKSDGSSVSSWWCGSRVGMYRHEDEATMRGKGDGNRSHKLLPLTPSDISWAFPLSRKREWETTIFKRSEEKNEGTSEKEKDHFGSQIKFKSLKHFIGQSI